METNWEGGTRETAAGFEESGKSGCCGNAKTVIADKLHKIAEALGKKTADRDAESGMGKYGKQASEWLDKSAEYVRQFDYKQADVKVRDYVRKNPGRSLVISGVVGLIIGAMCRRR